VQERRISQSGLSEFFDLVCIVDRKEAATFADIARTFDVDGAQAVSVGNSLRSDILPAIEAGIHGVLVDAHVWESSAAARYDPKRACASTTSMSGV